MTSKYGNITEGSGGFGTTGSPLTTLIGLVAGAFGGGSGVPGESGMTYRKAMTQQPSTPMRAVLIMRGADDQVCVSIFEHHSTFLNKFEVSGLIGSRVLWQGMCVAADL